MRRTILIILFIIITLTTVKAQRNIILGIKGGGNFSTITSEYYAENYRKPGFYFGALMEIPLVPKFSIQSEISYATYGADVFMLVDGGGPRETEFSLDYVQIPILGKIYILRNFSIEIGPSFNFLVKDKGYRPGLPDLYDTNGNFLRNQTDVDPYGSNFELSGLIGISYKLNKSMVASVRFTKGLTNALNPPHVLNKAKNNAFQFGIGFIF